MNPRYAWLRQLIAFGILLLIWEAAGRADMLNPLFMPTPARIGSTLYELFSDGRIWPHLEATFTAALGGLVLGLVVGVLLGILGALVPLVAELLEPGNYARYKAAAEAENNRAVFEIPDILEKILESPIDQAV